MSATEIIEAPSISARILARLCGSRLDRQLDAGAAAEPGSALDAHMSRLRSKAHREHLSAELRRCGTAVLCHRVVSPRRGQVDVTRVRDAANLIERVEERLLAQRPVSPRGTAKLRLLLGNRAGPLYSRGSGDLCADLRAVLRSL